MILRISLFLCLFLQFSCNDIQSPSNAFKLFVDQDDDYLEISVGTEIYLCGGNGWEYGHISSIRNDSIFRDTLVEESILSMKFDDSNKKHIATGMNGRILIAQDSIFSRPPYSFDINRSISFDSSYTVLVGGKSYKQGHIHLIDNNNQRITTQTFDHELNDIIKIEDTYICVGYGIILTSTQDFKWNKSNAEGDYFISVVKTDDQNVYVAGQNGTLLTSSDKGNHWTSIRIPGNIRINRLRAIEHSIYVLGDNGKLKTYDVSHKQWNTYDISNEDLHDCQYINGQLLVVGKNGFASYIDLE